MHLPIATIYNQSEEQDYLFVFLCDGLLAFKNYMQLALTEEKLYKTCNRSLPMRCSFHKLSKNKHRASQRASVFEFLFDNMEVEESIIQSICSRRRMP